MSRLALLLAPLPLLSACVEVACDDYAAASALVSVVGEDGSTPLVAVVTAEDGEGNPVDVSCAGADPDACTEWIVGYEVEGQITVRAEADDGCNLGTGTLVLDVPMDEDGCHVVQQEGTLVVDEWTDLDCG
jgi:hypothetical protein